jgi:D-alanyl-D-alanine carboxypeptidase/D-alanyl-D-alanine-endopeptidase (penicillin-binding protein 4)
LADDFQRTSRATVGISVVNLRTGQEVFARRARQTFIPASNQKLLTTAFALARLGADFQFTTTVARLGDSVVISGDFDPTLGDPRIAAQRGVSIYHELDRWSRDIRRSFEGTIPGDIIIHSRVGPGEFFHPRWKRRHRSLWYGAPVAGLNFHDNCFDVTFVAQGGRIVPRVAPASRYIRVINRTRPGPRQLWRLVPSKSDSVVTISGTVKSASSKPLSVAMTDPPMVLGFVLADRLAKAGVAIKGGLRRVGPAELDMSQAKVLCETKTPIFRAIRRANNRSLNLAGECLLLRAGDGTWPGSSELMRKTLVEKFALAPDELVISDGGGLSRANKVSPGNITRLLRGVIFKPYGPEFLASLARCGIDGTLRRRLRGKKYRGMVLGKTGYISGVVALSGYVLAGAKSSTGQADCRKPVFAFSILLNRVANAGQAKRFQNRLCRLLIRSAWPR